MGEIDAYQSADDAGGRGGAGGNAAAPVTAAPSAKDKSAIAAAVHAGHDATVKRLQDWIALPTIAAEKSNDPEGAEYMRKLALDAGFQKARIVQTDGVPGVFATLDAGAKDTLAHLFHVRRQAVRPGRMVVAAARGADRRPAGRGQGDRRPRRGQPEGAGNGLPGGASRLPGRRRQAAGQSGACRGRRGGNRLAPFPPDRRRPRGPGRAQEVGRDHHPFRQPGRRRRRSRSISAPRARSNCS